MFTCFPLSGDASLLGGLLCDFLRYRTGSDTYSLCLIGHLLSGDLQVVACWQQASLIWPHVYPDGIYGRRYLMIWGRRRVPGFQSITAKETSNTVAVEKRSSDKLWRDFLAQQPSKAEDAPTAQKTFLLVSQSERSVDANALCRQSLKRFLGQVSGTYGLPAISGSFFARFRSVQHQRSVQKVPLLPDMFHPLTRVMMKKTNSDQSETSMQQQH